MFSLNFFTWKVVKIEQQSRRRHQINNSALAKNTDFLPKARQGQLNIEGSQIWRAVFLSPQLSPSPISFLTQVSLTQLFVTLQSQVDRANFSAQVTLYRSSIDVPHYLSRVKLRPWVQKLTPPSNNYTTPQQISPDMLSSAISPRHESKRKSIL